MFPHCFHPVSVDVSIDVSIIVSKLFPNCFHIVSTLFPICCHLVSISLPFFTMTTRMPPTVFFEEGKTIFRGRKKTTRHQRKLNRDMDLFRAFFGTWPSVCSELWRRVDPINTLHPKSLAIHLLWALMLMCCYSTEVINGALAGVDEDTFRKWSMPWVRAISTLSSELIDFDMRFEGNWHYWTFCVDGKHCPIQEPRLPFWSGWFSHKFQSAGLSYEIATACTTGLIIWVNGPFPAGKWPDDKIFRRDLAHLVRTNIEKGICDAGYRNCERWLYKAVWRTKRGLRENWPRNDLHEYIRARHEQTNGRFDNWNCVSSVFRHARELHSDFFHAVVVITQLEIKSGYAKQFDIVPKPYVAGEQPIPQPPPPPSP